jgi:hypothetical protein
MTLENIDNTYIKISSGYLEEGQLMTVSVKDCCGNIYTDEFVWNTSLYIPTINGTVRIGDDLYISNVLLQQDSINTDGEISDGVYYVSLYENADSENILLDEGIIFFENKIRCMLAAKLQDYLNSLTTISQISTLGTKNLHTELHMLHWAIFISQSCLCMYDEMCQLFNLLWTNLTNSKSSDCGC